MRASPSSIGGAGLCSAARARIVDPGDRAHWASAHGRGVLATATEASRLRWSGSAAAMFRARGLPAFLRCSRVGVALSLSGAARRLVHPGNAWPIS